MERIRATYRVETPLPLEKAAEVLAGEQSSGTFVAVPGETAELRARFRATVDAVTPLETVHTPALPGSRPANAYHRGEIRISWPLDNIGPNLPTLVSTLQGNLYELREFSGLRLVDIDLPPSFLKHFPGPRFGIAGTRRTMNVHDRPMVGTIIKPSVGLTPAQTAEIVAQLAEAGIDFIKDDELMANPPHSPIRERIAAVMGVLNAHADRTGRRVMYAFNITDEVEAMLRHYELVRKAGGTAIMLSLNSVGLSAVKRICDEGALVVHGHRNGWGMLTRHPWIGMDFQAYQVYWRLAGVDQLHVNGIANKFWEDDDSVCASIQACLAPTPTAPIVPVVSSGQWGGQAFETWRRTRTIDLLYLAGGGIMAHPNGPAGGIDAIRAAWSAAVAGQDIASAAAANENLRLAVEKFGNR